MLGSFLIGFGMMWVAQLGLALFGWSRGSSMTVSGFRIHWENARFRDLIFVLRLAFGVLMAFWVFSSSMNEGSVVYFVGVLAAFFLPAISDLPVVLMKRWSVEPPSQRNASVSDKTKSVGRRGRDL